MRVLFQRVVALGAAGTTWKDGVRCVSENTRGHSGDIVCALTTAVILELIHATNCELT